MNIRTLGDLLHDHGAGSCSVTKTSERTASRKSSHGWRRRGLRLGQASGGRKGRTRSAVGRRKRGAEILNKSVADRNCPSAAARPCAVNINLLGELARAPRDELLGCKNFGQTQVQTRSTTNDQFWADVAKAGRMDGQIGRHQGRGPRCDFSITPPSAAADFCRWPAPRQRRATRWLRGRRAFGCGFWKMSSRSACGCGQPARLSGSQPAAGARFLASSSAFSVPLWLSTGGWHIGAPGIGLGPDGPCRQL